MSHPAFRRVDHRPWPVPARPWRWRQTWHQLVFLHWPVASASLRPLVPPKLTIEEFEGTAWVAVTPFWISGATLRQVPPIPVVSRFPELNVRTYVTLDRRPGVWFFSLDAGSMLAVLAARQLFRLAYFHARMSHRSEGRRVFFRSERPNGPAFLGHYEPGGATFESRPGSLEHWLTERYCLYAQRSGKLFRAEIHHLPWPLQPALVRLERNEMLTGQGIPVEGLPAQIHFAGRLEVVIWPLEPVDSGASGGKR